MGKEYCQPEDCEIAELVSHRMALTESYAGILSRWENGERTTLLLNCMLITPGQLSAIDKQIRNIKCPICPADTTFPPVCR